MRSAKVDIPLVCSLRVINQQLWCCRFDAGIVVLDSELQQQRTVPAGEMGWVYDVAEMSNGDVVIGASNGLYAADVLGKRIEGGGGWHAWPSSA